MNAERIKNFFKRNHFFITACACVLIFAAGVIIGEHIGWNSRDGEVATLTTQLEIERARLAKAKEEVVYWQTVLRGIVEGNIQYVDRPKATTDFMAEPRGDEED